MKPALYEIPPKVLTNSQLFLYSEFITKLILYEETDVLISRLFTETRTSHFRLFTL